MRRSFARTRGGPRQSPLGFLDGGTRQVRRPWPVSGSNRVLRGGNWNNDSGNCRAANRNNNNNPGNSNNNIGFRFVRSSEDSPHGVHDSDPAAIPAAPFHPARQSENARPVLVGMAAAVPNAPGGQFHREF